MASGCYAGQKGSTARITDNIWQGRARVSGSSQAWVESKPLEKWKKLKSQAWEPYGPAPYCTDRSTKQKGKDSNYFSQEKGLPTRPYMIRSDHLTNSSYGMGSLISALAVKR